MFSFVKVGHWQEDLYRFECVLVIVWCVCLCGTQRSPRRMLTPLVSALLELCENPQAVTHLLRWSGDRDTSAPQLLLHIWRREEETTGVSRDPHGMIAGAHAIKTALFTVKHLSN